MLSQGPWYFLLENDVSGSNLWTWVSFNSENEFKLLLLSVMNYGKQKYAQSM